MAVAVASRASWRGWVLFFAISLASATSCTGVAAISCLARVRVFGLAFGAVLSVSRILGRKI